MTRTQQCISVLWPSFAMAIVASGVFFSAFDPRELVPYDLDMNIGPVAAYSIGFFLFWLLCILSSWGTLYFAISNSRLAARRHP